MAFQFNNLTELPIQISICRNPRHKDPLAVVVVFTAERITGPVLRSQLLNPGQEWQVTEFDYRHPVTVKDRLALKRQIQRFEKVNLRFRLQSLFN